MRNARRWHYCELWLDVNNTWANCDDDDGDDDDDT